MNLKIFAVMLCVMPSVAYSATRAAAVDGAGRASRASARGSGMTATMNTSGGVASAHTTRLATSGGAATGNDSTNASGAACRDAYRACMDDFCLADESEGGRCICSGNIDAAQSLLSEIKELQAQADNLLNVETQKARLGAKADLVFDQKSTDGANSVNDAFDSVYGNKTKNTATFIEEDEIGDALYDTAVASCQSLLDACGDRAEMEELLYSRMITSDCKSYNAYLNEQKTYAEQNKSAAELAVVNARLEVLDQTDKYNRGECLLAYKACISDKGGCGIHFENCYEENGTALLDRRAAACENILNQCVASRQDVKNDWDAEKLTIKTEAKKYISNNLLTSCNSQITLCLEENCSYETNAACLNNVAIARAVCPIIDECNTKVNQGLSSVNPKCNPITGRNCKNVDGFDSILDSVNDSLAALRRHYCENDMEACLKDKCGVDFTGPQCLGKSQQAIAQLCPKDSFNTCKNVDPDDYNISLSSILLQLDNKQVQGCVNYFSERLGSVCGTDMSCLPDSALVASLDTVLKGDAYQNKVKEVRQEAVDAVSEFFTRFNNDKTIGACMTAGTVNGTKYESGLGDTVFNTAKMIAEESAKSRAVRQLETKMAELSRQESIEKAEQNCTDLYKKDENPDTTIKNYTYISSVSFEPSLRNCHVCRKQQVCEKGGEKWQTSALKSAAGGLTAGAAMGTQINAGWGTAIGGIVGAVGAGVLGGFSGGQEEFCQEVESCEDINM